MDDRLFAPLGKFGSLPVLREVDEEIRRIQSLLERDQVATPSCLYRAPGECSAVLQQLEDHKKFAPRLKAYLAQKFANRHAQLKVLTTKYSEDLSGWQRYCKRFEETSTDAMNVARPLSAVHVPNILPPHPDRLINTQPHSSYGRVGDVHGIQDMDVINPVIALRELDNLEPRWMASAAVVPLQHAGSAKCIFDDRFVNENRLVPANEPRAYSEQAETFWTETEERIFVDRYLAYPKNFKMIAAALPFKTSAECVRFYYHNKRRLNLKALHVAAQMGPAIVRKRSYVQSALDDPVGKRLK